MSFSPASGRDELEASLRSFGGRADAEIDIAEAALILAAFDRPGVSLSHYRQHLSRLARDTADLGERHGATASLHGRVAALNAVMLERYGYAGDRLTYDDIQNANLMRVIDRRKGLPVALGILYHPFHVAAAHKLRNHVGLVLFLSEVEDGDNVWVRTEASHRLSFSLDASPGGVV